MFKSKDIKARFDYTSKNVKEWDMFNSLSNEVVQRFGVDIYFIPMEVNSVDLIHGDIDVASFNKAYPIRMYLKTNEGFESGGGGDMYTKFSYYVPDTAQFVVNIEEFGNLTDGRVPTEGDLLYLPFHTGRLFQLYHVEEENDAFYHLGKRMLYRLDASLFEYNRETVNTNVEEINDLVKDMDKNDGDNVRINTSSTNIVSTEEEDPLGSL